MSKRVPPEKPVLTAAWLKEASRKSLAILEEEPGEGETLAAQWPEPVLELTAEERETRVRRGAETVLMEDRSEDGKRRMRGFIRSVLKVPLESDQGKPYGVFVEVGREAYQSLQVAFREKSESTVWGTLATRLPFLEEAYGSEVLLLEDGSEKRARVLEAKHPLVNQGPSVGPMDK
jgi:hypothetical protein